MGLSRSEQMARIRGRDTSPEWLLRRALFRAGLRFRVQAITPVGRPDVVFPRAKVAVFVDGCQWHGCPDHYVRPRTRSEFWGPKLAGNVTRDQRQTRELEAAGWRVIRMWEHQVFVELPCVVALVEAAVRGSPVPCGVSWRVVRVDVLDDSGNLERRHLVELRGAAEDQVVERARSTAKWSRRVQPDSGG